MREILQMMFDDLIAIHGFPIVKMNRNQSIKFIKRNFRSGGVV